MAKLDERVFKFKLNYRELDWFVSSDEEHLNLTVKTHSCQSNNSSQSETIAEFLGRLKHILDDSLGIRGIYWF